MITGVRLAGLATPPHASAGLLSPGPDSGVCATGRGWGTSSLRGSRSRALSLPTVQSATASRAFTGREAPSFDALTTAIAAGWVALLVGLGLVALVAEVVS